MALFPIFVELADKPCLVVGGGEVAWRKTAQLLEAGARVTVNAPVVADHRLAELVRGGQVTLVEDDYSEQLTAAAFLVIAATSDNGVNASVAAAAARNRVPCNVVDDIEHCSFIMPATIQRGPVSIAISTAGYAPVLARWIKASIENWLPARIDMLAGFAGRWRRQVKQSLGTITARRRLWEEVFEGSIAEHVLAGREAAANRDMTEALAVAGQQPESARGEAWLVGAGPGDAGLITVRGKQLLAKADVVLYDRLVGQELLRFARREAELIFVGKRPGHASIQDEINRLLVEHVRKGKRVCRLKGGDPFIFGRGGEELEALEAAGLAYQVVPGISAAMACAAYAGIPLTHRSAAHAVWLGTGHEASGDTGIEWQALAASGQTLALYMSVGRIGQIAERLQAHGRDPSTPCALVENGTRREQRVVKSDLASVARDAADWEIRAPAILFVGEAVAQAGCYNWFAPDGFIDARHGWSRLSECGVAS